MKEGELLMALIDVQIGMPTFLDLVRARCFATDLPAEALDALHDAGLYRASPSRPWNWSTVRLAAAGVPIRPRDRCSCMSWAPSMRQTARLSLPHPP